MRTDDTEADSRRARADGGIKSYTPKDKISVIFNVHCAHSGGVDLQPFSAGLFSDERAGRKHRKSSPLSRPARGSSRAGGLSEAPRRPQEGRHGAPECHKTPHGPHKAVQGLSGPAYGMIRLDTGVQRQTGNGRIPRQRLDLRDAADVLGLTVDAVRKRVKRGTLDSEKGADGRLYVFLDTDQESDHPRSDTDRLISVLEEQLRQEREAHAEARRLLAAALERIPPQLEAPTAPAEPRESPETPAEPRPSATGPPGAETPAEARPWWRRVFGG